MVCANRYDKESRKRKAYVNACELIEYYGTERKHWNYKAFGLNRTEMKDIWNTATRDINGKSRVDYICNYKCNK